MRKPLISYTNVGDDGTIVYLRGTQEAISLFADWIKNTIPKKHIFISIEMDSRFNLHARYLVQRDEDVTLIKLKWT